MARIDALLRAARSHIGGHLESGEPDWLLAHVLGRSRGWLYAHADEVLDAEVAARFEALLARRIAGEPVAYLTGHRGFWRFDLQVTPATLIPRPETELLVELALARLPAGQALRIADLGTGSGAIALAIAHERPQAQVVATDASAGALVVARGNAQKLGLGNIEFREGDWCTPLADERFDLIASNPPYLAEDDDHIGRGDLRYEPRSALASGADGLDASRVIARDAPRHLHPGGWLMIEHGWDQGEAMQGLLHAADFIDVQTAPDLAHRDRITFGRRPA